MRASRSDIDALPVFPLKVDAFLSGDECQSLLAFLSSDHAEFGAFDLTADYWAGRTLAPDRLTENSILDSFRHIRDRVVKTIHGTLEEHFGPQPPLFADLVNFARWPSGYELHPHADSENPGGVPHPFPWRDFASVIYLNDEYEGGEIYFPNLGIELKPRPGTLIAFPGTLRYLHGVRRVTSGMRHTIASFITFDESKRYEF
jgi:predicted 2-oxoglutarate/Fe(II)-dependent dioxygenase YbiX